MFHAWAQQLNCALCHTFRQMHATRVTRPMPRPDAPGLDFGLDYSLGHICCHAHKYTYFLIIIDLCSRYIWTIGLKNNTAPEFVSAFQSWWKRRRQRVTMGLHPCTLVIYCQSTNSLVIENGGHDTASANMFTMLRIRLTTSVPTQQYGNSGIESHVKEFNYARATIHQERCNHPKHWYDVVQAATVARNFVMTRSQFVSGEQLSPYEIETGRKPPLDRLKVPMSLGYKLIDDADRPRPSTLKPQREPVMVCYLAIEDINQPS